MRLAGRYVTVPYGHFFSLGRREALSTHNRTVRSQQMQPGPTNRRDQRRDAILAVAREVFFEEGYAAASMSAIAARLGGSKATLYSYFTSKEALFEAHIRDQCGRFAEGLLEFPEDRPVAEVLARFGETYIDHLLSDRAVRTFQVIVAEARRTPELARLFYEVGPAVGLRRFTLYLERAKAMGKIDPPDCELAASEFMALCKGHRHLTLALGLAPRPTPPVIAAEVASAVAMFMARYGVGEA